jgi:hypothetical protein
VLYDSAAGIAVINPGNAIMRAMRVKLTQAFGAPEDDQDANLNKKKPPLLPKKAINKEDPQAFKLDLLENHFGVKSFSLV